MVLANKYMQFIFISLSLNKINHFKLQKNIKMTQGFTSWVKGQIADSRTLPRVSGKSY